MTMTPRDTDHPAGRAGPPALLVAAFVCLGAFAALAAAISAGAHPACDGELLCLLRAPGDPADPLGPVWLRKAARDVTALGSVYTLCLLTAGAAGALLLARRGRDAFCLMAAAGGAVLIARFAKDLIDRPRPALVAHGDVALSASFPSGHAILSAAVFLTAGALLARSFDRRGLILVLASAAALVALVGASRIYLGVQWPTDVIAGWLGGAGWALLCLGAARLVEGPRTTGFGLGAPPRQTDTSGRLET
jgi:undecaprenyl-diphosphatase